MISEISEMISSRSMSDPNFVKICPSAHQKNHAILAQGTLINECFYILQHDKHCFA